MPLKVGGSQKDLLSPLTIKVDEIEVKIKYRVGLYTPAFMEKFDSKPITDFIEAIVESWDIMFDDSEDIPKDLRGRSVPIRSKEIGEYVPMVICRAIMQEVDRDSFPNLRNLKNSGNSS